MNVTNKFFPRCNCPCHPDLDRTAPSSSGRQPYFFGERTGEEPKLQTDHQTYRQRERETDSQRDD